MKRVIKLGVEWGPMRSEDEVELPADWDSMTEQEQADHLQELAGEHINNNIDSWANVVEVKT